ncbi:22730_t:CDS:2 [Rhizophagus irregularis]|nr:22730_t:CDS:2 [Rhizophagus irregularis]
MIQKTSEKSFTENIGETYKDDSGVVIKFSKFIVSNFTEKHFRRGEVKDIFRNTGEMDL